MPAYNLDKNIAKSMFRAYDIRGIVSQDLTENAVYSIGLAIGSEAQSRGQTQVIIGRDGRLSGPMLIKALGHGLLDSGCDVIDIGMVPTPLVYYACHILDTQSGVMLTGSHNPANYNGLKIVIAGDTLAEQDITKLYQRIASNDLSSGQGIYSEKNIFTQYMQRISSDIQLQRPLKIVVDCGNGVAGAVAPALYRQLGCEVIELYCDVDGHFPNHHPDPSKPDNLTDLIAKVKAEQADVGLAFDGDADRLGVVTSAGEIVYPDRQLILYAIDILARNPGSEIIYDIKCSRHVAKQIAEYGGQPTMWKTGHSLVKAKLKEAGAPLAGEMSGHMFFKERWYGFDDGIYTGARLLEIIAKDDRDSASIFADIPQDTSTPEINVAMADDKKFAFVEKLVQQGDFAGAKKITIDGLRVEYPEGWGLVRCSNTTPNLVLRFEANDTTSLEKVKTIVKTEMKKFEPTLELNF